MFITKKSIVLASASSRRHEYLTSMGIDHLVYAPAIDETPLPGEKPIFYVCRMARTKALTVMERYPQSWIIAADTAVFRGGIILDKPNNPHEALETLMFLSGSTHEVATAFCVGSKTEAVFHEECVITTVEFALLSEDLARAYVATGEPFDKAGCYGIQGIGGVLVNRVEGSYSNVVGLPLSQLMVVLRKYHLVDLE